jgi:hypothetical protein
MSSESPRLLPVVGILPKGKKDETGGVTKKKIVFS